MPVAPYSVRAGGMMPGPVPSTGNPELERYVAEELAKIVFQLQTGSSQFITLELLGREPARLVDGLICFFVEGVVAPQRGLYEYHSGNWSKL